MNASMPAGVPVVESWFDVLDQRRFVVGDERFTAQVAGVHVAGFDTWIQLEFEEDRRRSLLLHLTPETGVRAAVETIRVLLQRRQIS
jgi:sugar phosphate isomerase/epimerase